MLVTRNLDLRLGAEYGVFESQFQVVPEIGAPLDSASPPAGSSTKEIAKTEDVAKNVTEVREYARIETAESAAGRRSKTGVTETIVLRALLAVA